MKEVVALAVQVRRTLFVFLSFVLLVFISGCGLTNDIYNSVGGRDEIIADINTISQTVMKSNIRIRVRLSEKQGTGGYYLVGSGFIYESDTLYYYAFTNAHLFSYIEDGEKVDTRISSIDIDDYLGENEYSASIVKIDELYDIAVVKFLKDVDTPLEEVTFASSYPNIGEVVYAIGNPLGQMNSITIGKYKGITNNVLGFPEDSSMIQSDAPIDHGNSGGMLLNQDLEVIGMNTSELEYRSIKYSGSIVYEELLAFIEDI